MLDEQGGKNQDRQNQAAKPPGDRCRRQTQSRFRKELKEKHAGGDQDAAAKKDDAEGGALPRDPRWGCVA